MDRKLPDHAAATADPDRGFCLVFDVGKTNKKAFVFDEHYRVVEERSAVLPETTDEDGFPCEDLARLREWVLDTFRTLLDTPSGTRVRAVHCTAYGASLVHLDAVGEPLTPLYNYLKPCPSALTDAFFQENGPRADLSLETASPILGFLNSGMQLYWLRRQHPGRYRRIRWSLHLPQYLAWLLAVETARRTGRPYARLHPTDERTSLGCHTFLWDFRRNDYHTWVRKTGIVEKFPPLRSQDWGWTFPWQGGRLRVGIGLHDSSAALVPYLATTSEPFLLLSTGTWCIALNPFDRRPLTLSDLSADCLSYNSIHGSPVKAARYFGGNRHDGEVRSMARRFGVAEDFYRSLSSGTGGDELVQAYHTLMESLVGEQVASLALARGDTLVTRLYVDGGFSHNPVFMAKLAAAVPDCSVYAASVAQATALGAALAIRDHWNPGPLREGLVESRRIG
ncbi:MAG: hypothetical protein RLY31_1413 [Bacteroidota bacterium]|jgi:sugar (pentulose or hexulose) kinase